MTDKSPLPVLLVVEDDEGLQRQLKWAYEGYQVVCVGDRAAAIEALRSHEPAVVTLDLGLPPDPDGTAEGFATLEEILRLKRDYRYHFILKAASREKLNASLRRMLAFSDGEKIPRTNVIVDVDALSLL